MKIVNDDGEVLFEGPDNTALLVFKEDDEIMGILPNFPEGDDHVPAHTLLAGETLVFVHDEDNRAEIDRFFRRQTSGAH